MEPIQNIGELTSGDVVHHPALGFAVVDRILSGAATLAWEHNGPRLPAQVTTDLLTKGYQRCTPGGFLQKSVLGINALKLLVRERPTLALRMLLDELGEPLNRSQIHDWMTGRNIILSGEFDRWWSALRSAIDGDTSLCWDTDTDCVGLPEIDVDGADPEQFLASTPSVRWRIAIGATPEVQLRLLHQAITARDTEAILLLLRLGQPIPDKTRSALRTLAANGNHEVAAALLVRGDNHTLQHLVAPAGRTARRHEVTAVLEQLAPTLCLSVMAQLLEEALTIEGDPPAANWLVAQSTDGARGLLDASVARGDCPRAIEWLMEQSATHDAHESRPQKHATQDNEDTIVDGDTVDLLGTSEIERTTQPLIAQLRDLPAGRLFNLSVATAKAIAQLHAVGSTGGVSGARVAEDGRVFLGPKEDRHPADDVRDAMRALLEAAVGPLPTERAVQDEELLAHASLLRPDLPVDWLAVLGQSLAVDRNKRPQNGLALWSRLKRAQASHAVRKTLPPHRLNTLSLAHDTHIGILKSRIMQTNQDAVFFDAKSAITILLVADGISVSTVGTGNLASALLVQSMAATWERSYQRLIKATTHEVSDWLVSALAEANTTICERSLQIAEGNLEQKIPMGTTAVVAIIRGNEAFLASVGDSRIYLVGDNGVALLSGDQNVRGLWLETARRGEREDFGNEGFALVGYCGRFNEHLEPCPAPPVLRTVQLLEGETLCLCTDGLTDYAAKTMAENDEIIAAGAAHERLSEGCHYLVGKANQGGGGDNISVILARISAN
jgi:serine/threonine protein phosphatase PrpC